MYGQKAGLNQLLKAKAQRLAHKEFDRQAESYRKECVKGITTLYNAAILATCRDFDFDADAMGAFLQSITAYVLPVADGDVTMKELEAMGERLQESVTFDTV